MSDFTEMVQAWAAWAAAVVEDWPEDPRHAAPAWEALEQIARRTVRDDA